VEGADDGTKSISEGDFDGAEFVADVGFLEGLVVGWFEGLFRGLLVGEIWLVVGIFDGSMVGWDVGILDGEIVMKLVGVDVGIFEGDIVGWNVGLLDGEMTLVGVFVGIFEGNIVGWDVGLLDGEPLVTLVGLVDCLFEGGMVEYAFGIIVSILDGEMLGAAVVGLARCGLGPFVEESSTRCGLGNFEKSSVWFRPSSSSLKTCSSPFKTTVQPLFLVNLLWLPILSLLMFCLPDSPDGMLI
jgi:hypothetical protein